MSLKAELETWVSALAAYDAEDFERALELFSQIADTSKIRTNMGLIYATLGEHEAAVEQFQVATQLDSYLAVAYFQCGVSNFLLGKYDVSYRDFEEALLYLRGNQSINYDQIGLKFKLFSAEVLFNKGLSSIYMGRADEGLADMEEAKREKATEEHNVIDDAIQDRGEGYTVFSIPVGVLYRPSESKIKNSKTKDYLGKAKLVATSDASDAYTTFTGVTRLQRGQTPTGAPLDPSRLPPVAASAAGSGAGAGSASLGRSVTLPTPRSPSTDGTLSGARALERAKTTLNVPGAARADPVSPGGASGLGRSNTTLNVRPLGAGAGAGGVSPLRSLSVRQKPSGAAGAGSPPAPPEKPRAAGPPSTIGPSRLTEFYDNFVDSYGDEAPPVPQSQNQSLSPNANPNARVAQWAASNAQPGNPPVSRAGSRYAPSSVGGSMRRRPTRRGTMSARSRGPAMSAYDEEEEGYVSGEYEEYEEFSKIRVKLYHDDDVRGMTLNPDASFVEFCMKVAQKFGRPTPKGEGIPGLAMKFQDEDGGKVSLRDESDFELAVETAREQSRSGGRPGAEGKLSVWLTEA